MTEGKLLLQLLWDGSQVQEVEIRSTRAFVAGRLLAGRQPQQAVDTVPLIYSLCGKAQGIAACLAVEQALGKEPAPGILLLRHRLVLLEAVQEYLWRLYLDWPQWAGLDPVPQQLAPMRHRLGETLRLLQDGAGWKTVGADSPDPALHERWEESVAVLEQFLAREVLGTDPTPWLSLTTMAQLGDWMHSAQTHASRTLLALLPEAGLGTCEPARMPHPAPDWWRRDILPCMRETADFAQAPDWDGRPLETGSAMRMAGDPLVAAVAQAHGFGLLARLVARLRELVLLAGRLRGLGHDWLAAFSDRPGEGVACVETARGLLTHRVEVKEGKIAAFQIVAPTEWNFHPQGPLKRALSGLRADNEKTLKTRAGWLVQALDPCVGFELKVTHA